MAAWPVSAASPQVAAFGDGSGISMASLRKFWAVAARWSSSRAPFGPRNTYTVRRPEAASEDEQTKSITGLKRWCGKPSCCREIEPPVPPGKEEWLSHAPRK